MVNFKPKIYSQPLSFLDFHSCLTAISILAIISPSVQKPPPESPRGTCKSTSWGFKAKGANGQNCTTDSDCTNNEKRVCCPVEIEGEENPMR